MTMLAVTAGTTNQPIMDVDGVFFALSEDLELLAEEATELGSEVASAVCEQPLDEKNSGYGECLLDWRTDGVERCSSRDRTKRGRVVDPEVIRELTISDQVNLAFDRSGYPLQGVNCSSHEEALTLSGIVSRYFFAQMAINTVNRIAPGQKLNFQIKVVQKPVRQSTDDKASSNLVCE